MSQALTTAHITMKGRDKQDGLQWRQLTGANKTRLALGVAPPVEWVSAHKGEPRVMQELQEEFIRISAEYLPDVCKGLREYQLTVLQSLEAAMTHIKQYTASGTTHLAFRNQTQRRRKTKKRKRRSRIEQA